MPTAPPSITTPPTAPSRADVGTFATRADAWVAWEETNLPLVGQASDATYDNAVEAQASATAAQASALSVGASLWVSGTTYATDDVRRSPINGLPYRRLTDGAGTTDPSADVGNWALAVAASPVLIDVTGTTVNLQAWGHYLFSNAAVTTGTLPASPAAGDLIWVTVGNGLRTNVLARNGNKIMAVAEDLTINDGNATLALRYLNATQGWRLM